MTDLYWWGILRSDTGRVSRADIRSGRGAAHHTRTQVDNKGYIYAPLPMPRYTAGGISSKSPRGAGEVCIAQLSLVGMSVARRSRSHGQIRRDVFVSMTAIGRIERRTAHPHTAMERRRRPPMRRHETTHVTAARRCTVGNAVAWHSLRSARVKES